MFISRYKYNALARELEQCKNRSGKIFVTPQELEEKYGIDAIKRFVSVCWPNQKTAIFCIDDKYDFTPDEYVYICTGITNATGIEL